MPPPETDFTPYFQGKKVLITGGLGFIGSNLAHRLVELGAHVLLVDSLIPKYGGNVFNVADIQDRLRINIADVRDEHGLRYLVQGQEVIFNLAGQVSHTDSMNDPYADLEINVRSQLSLLEACRHGNPQAKIIFASTRQIYGKPAYLPVDENHPLQPVDVNGINKLAGEWYHIVYHHVYGLQTVSLRLTNTYGPRMRVKDARQTFMGWWLRQLVESQTLQIFGDGRQVRDFNYVDDVVTALLLVVVNDSATGQIYNLGGREPISLLDLAQLLINLNQGGRYDIVPFPEDRQRIDIGDYTGDYSKIRHELGWEPQITLCDGLARTLDYYREHLAHYV
ncbi:MAG: GDP-mannose 4,6-dehydratase [Chloroflexi bacterium]|nr:GDP-mannose 4,6-dehydratase [Chloroflexota bacterium]MCI0576125.1 GDP-mannose 4,6-dehydratase [Chloroflexota bacterium]MCI0647913.1 GDP-mannose 4,6-dehydratase [Chloroflexota bacterium]MCI0727164.1 GDP-mannose 4,6-dehydratase [Chloroflexota bacterium]